MSNSIFSIFIKVCNYHHCLILEHIHHFKKKPCTHYIIPNTSHFLFLPLLSSWQPLTHFLSLWICLFSNRDYQSSFPNYTYTKTAYTYMYIPLHTRTHTLLMRTRGICYTNTSLYSTYRTVI